MASRHLNFYSVEVVVASKRSGGVQVSVLNLVKFRSEFFPLSVKDFELLQERGSAVFRMHETTLSILHRTVLKGLKITVHPWATVYPQLYGAFRNSLEKLSGGAFETKAQSNWILIRNEQSDSLKEKLDISVNQLTQYMGRYGVRTARESKAREPYTLTRLLFTPDPELSPSLYFSDPPDKHLPVTFKFHFSEACRLQFRYKTDKKTLGVLFEDKAGDDYRETFSRAFPISRLKEEDCLAGIDFFCNMISLLNAHRSKSRK